MMNVFIWVVLIGLAVLFLWIAYRTNFKNLVLPSVALITGGVKTGKSLLSVKLSQQDFKRRHRHWWFMTHVFRQVREEPLYYTNCKISFGKLDAKKPHRLDKYIRQVTKESLLRKERFAYGSVIFIDEASLLADNMDYQDKGRNIDLSLFVKLIGHETRGGALYYDTQCVLDVHYALKRGSSTYIFIQKKINCLLFFVLYVREMINTENGVNNFTDDVDDTTRKVIVPFWYKKRYDCYELSYFTDGLPVSDRAFVPNNGLVSFNPMYISRADKRKKIKKEKSKNA